MNSTLFDPACLDFELPRELIATKPDLGNWFKDCRLIVFDRKTGKIENHPFEELPEILDDRPCYANNAWLDESCSHLWRLQCIWADHKARDKGGRGTFAVPSAGLPIDIVMKNELNLRYLQLFTPENKNLNVDDMYRENKSLKEFFRFEDPLPMYTKFIAIGTTVVKALESFSNVPGVTIEGNEGISELLITPGHEFRNVSGILTNFHYPKEPLMALVAAFMGVDQIKELYKYAVDYGIRFVDFGDRLLVI
jgi:hypothetical protein